MTGGGGEPAGAWEDQQAYVVHSERRDIEDSINKLLVVQTTCKPYDRYEFPNHTWQFPARLTYNTDTSATVLTLINGKIPLRSDVDFDYIGHRTRTVVACLLQKFSINQFQVAQLSPTFYLSSPGAGSVFFGQIDANTIYANLAGGATEVIISDSGGPIEYFPFSSVIGAGVVGGGAIPDGTLPDYYRLVARCIPWKGNIWVREYLIVSESRDLVDDADTGVFDGGDFDNA